MALSLFLTSFFSPREAWAAQDSQQTQPIAIESKETSSPSEFEKTLLTADIVVSEWLNQRATDMDLFLIGKKLTDRPNETSLRVENSTYYSQPTGLTDAPSISARLHLPNVEQYWSLKFTTYDENTERTVQQSQLRQSPRQTNYGATLGVADKLGDVNTAFQPRIQLQDPLKISHSLSFSSTADMKKYTIHPKFEFYADADRGAGMFQSINFRFNLTDIYTLTEINEGDYVDRQHAYSVSNGLALNQKITGKSSFTYSFFANSNNRDNYHLEAYHLAVSWYQNVYRKILEYSITPQLNFERTVGFEGVPAIAVNVGLNF